MWRLLNDQYDSFEQCNEDKVIDHAQHFFYLPASQSSGFRDSAYYRCVEDHFERFEQVYEERFLCEKGDLSLS
ncbi:MAG: hypothetical protein ACE5I8_06070 [Thermodesulfobacteriota bacterium]